MRQFVYCLLFIALPVHLLQAHQAGAVVVPRSSCYVLDNSSHIHDFTTWIGHAFDYDGKQDADLAVRFCKDVETRSQTGYVDFGRFDKFNHFVAGSGPVNFVQEFYNGDLRSCETSYDKLGRTAQVNIICGSCPNAQCKGALGCICNVTYESACRSLKARAVLVELAIPCEEQGSRVFEGFTVGFHPRSWEVVYDGMTQLGFEKSHHEFSFKTEQAHVSLYMTAIASLSRLVQKPIVKTFPENGLKVKLSGSAAEGKPPTTLSPSVLVVEWRCVQVSDSPYEVQISIPIEGYDPIQFTLTKFCESRQSKDGDTMRGWAMFGVVSCIFIVLSSLICCGGFLYKTRVEQQHGLDALPGMAILTACLDTLSGGGQGYSGAGEFSSGFANQASWERQSASSVRTTTIQSERKYGSM